MPNKKRCLAASKLNYFTASARLCDKDFHTKKPELGKNYLHLQYNK